MNDRHIPMQRYCIGWDVVRAGDGRPVSHRSSDSARLSRFVGPKMSFPIVVTSCAGSRVYHHW